MERHKAQDGCYLPEGVHDGRGPDERMRDEARKDALEDKVREDAAVGPPSGLPRGVGRVGPQSKEAGPRPRR